MPTCSNGTRNGGGAVRNRAEALLRSLGFDEDVPARRMGCSPARATIGIACCLLAEPDLLLLTTG
jgi:hypothetical protein